MAQNLMTQKHFGHLVSFSLRYFKDGKNIVYKVEPSVEIKLFKFYVIHWHKEECN
jgi:hypothetical protein